MELYVFKTGVYGVIWNYVELYVLNFLLNQL